MYPASKIAWKYLRYRMAASNGKGHGVHSPFVYEFVTQVLNDNTVYPDYLPIERLRKKLLSDNTPVPKEDYGAGTAFSRNDLSRSVAKICENSAKSPKYAQLLYRIVRFYRPHQHAPAQRTP